MFFELEDIKRRHTPYWDEYNTGSWITTPDSSMTWNYQRGVMAGVTGAVINETSILFSECGKLLLRKYEWPNSLKQYGIFAREIFKMENWKKGIKNRLQYALTIGATDFAARISVFRATHGGWYRPYNSFDVNFIRKIPTSIFAGAVTSWVGVPFEMARMAYYADKTFPKELQRGYTSYWNALRRIPFEEGPYYLFKNSFPFVMRNFFQTVSLFFTYDWIKNQLTVLFRNADFPLFPVKLFAATTAVYFASIFSYPWGEMIREMVDYWPKEKNGVCTWGGNYRRAAVWLWYHEFANNYYPGLFTNYFWRQAPAMFVYLWVADSLGMFTYWSHNYHAGGGSNTWEDAFA